MSINLRHDFQSGASISPESAASEPERAGFWQRLRTTGPTIAVIVGLVSFAVWGHVSEWKIPKLSSLFGAGAEQKADWCDEHNVPESTCVECNKSLCPPGVD